MRPLREALVTFQRSPLLSALSVTTIAFSLFALGLFGLVALNIREALERLEDRVEIRAFVTDGTPAEDVVRAATDIAAYPEVLSAQVVTQEQALKRAQAELGEFKDVFEGAVLPGSIDLRLKPGMRDPATVKRVSSRVKAFAFIDDIRYGEEWIEKLYRLRNIAGIAGLALGLAFAIVSVIIIGATIRMAVLARAREISIMRLVGATDAYIRRPFLVEGFAKGVMGGLFALAMTWIAQALIDKYVIHTIFFDARIAFLGLLFGALIGLAGSAVSVGRHLRRV
ncbi:MAG TPA: permease-like cell division protein FtsX [Gemmatimonadaceae bacterium]|jgi:cell division transport system permease protein|nr:permease-like cell division protein FtsX [Gemmatimonadaceae bacterium]